MEVQGMLDYRESEKQSKDLNPQADYCTKRSPRRVFDGALYGGNNCRDIGMDRGGHTGSHSLHWGAVQLPYVSVWFPMYPYLVPRHLPRLATAFEEVATDNLK